MRLAMVEIFKQLGISDETAKVAAKGRPVVGVDADDAIFHTFMILEDYHRRLAHLMMRWAQRHGFTHQRQFEEPLETFDVSEEADGMELVEMTLHKDYWACEWGLALCGTGNSRRDGKQMSNSDPPEWVRLDEQPFASAEPPFCIRPGWDVLIETEPLFRARALGDSSTPTSNAVTDMSRREDSSKLLKSANWILSTRKLALHQVRRWNPTQIADWDQENFGDDTKGEDVIRKGISSAAKSCGLRLIPGKPGRPIIRK